MRLSKSGYYADFVIYLCIVLAACTLVIWRDTPYRAAIWLLIVSMGALCWTLFEYLIHRFVLHRVPPFAPMHTAHHRAPLALVGTPTWLSLSIIVGIVFLPAWILSSFVIASGLAVGVMAGFLWYGVVHHAIHYRRPHFLATRLLGASRRHAEHHSAKQSINFGVTTGFWDQLFGTRIRAAPVHTSSSSIKWRATSKPYDV